MAEIERERKFLVRLADLGAFVPPNADRMEIEQAYLAVGPQGTLRVRRKRKYCDSQDVYLLTCKGPKTAGTAQEIEFEISQERYTALVAVRIGRLVRKTRLVISLNGHTVEIDVFANPLAPLCIAEIEGENYTSFIPPSWFGREVTGDPRYDNSALAFDIPPLV